MDTMECYEVIKKNKKVLQDLYGKIYMWCQVLYKLKRWGGASKNTIVFAFIGKIQKKLIGVITHGDNVEGDIGWLQQGRKSGFQYFVLYCFAFWTTYVKPTQVNWQTHDDKKEQGTEE